MSCTNSFRSTELTTLEMIAADYLLFGFSTAKICKILELPPGKVKALCLSVCKKLGVNSRKELLNSGPALLSTYQQKKASR